MLFSIKRCDGGVNIGRILLIPLLAFCLFAQAPSAYCETQTFPVRIDYPLLRSLVVYKAFRGPGESVSLDDEGHGCNRVTISEPRFSSEESLIRFETRIKATGAVFLLGKCRMSVDWEGYLVMLQKPVIKPDDWVMSFEIVDSRVYDLNRKPATIAGIVWDLIKERVFGYLGGITINLSPPVEEVKGFLLPLFPPERKDTALKMVESMRPGDVILSDDAIRVEVLAEVEGRPGKAREPSPDEILSKKEIDSFIGVWETWDSFLVQTILALFGEPLSSEEKEILLAALLDTRHRFSIELEGVSPANPLNRDFVREQFVSVWSRISPVMRNHLGTRPSESITSYLCFFTAADALTALDRIGPSLGIEISRNGLVRLIRLLASGEATGLAYPRELNPSLRHVLGLGEPLPASGPAFDLEELDSDNGEPLQGPQENGVISILDRFKRFLVSRCEADGGPGKKELEAIRPWLPDKKDIDGYLERVRGVLKKSTEEALKKSSVPSELRTFFRRMVLATSWQESCFRQFIEKAGKVTYLKSYNNTSVGVMQINERVWRGLYDPRHLRWDIAYNARAGCEILEQYLVRYALKGRASPGPEVNAAQEDLARLLYAMYNGGPGERKKFDERSAKKAYQLSDRLFFEKYNWVLFNEWSNISGCM
ncbi:MAG: lytic transglycosylase domain-containing protein [Desulfobacteraceae bacterium]|nr:MAG: lytic transglycosylase domain-containing protein [Desulfobacteraceae bacterium]